MVTIDPLEVRGGLGVGGVHLLGIYRSRVVFLAFFKVLVLLGLHELVRVGVVRHDFQGFGLDRAFVVLGN